MKNVKKSVESDSITKMEEKGLYNSSIDLLGEERYNSRYLEKGRGGREGKEADNCFKIIKALYKKEFINLETYMEIKEKYGRKK